MAVSQFKIDIFSQIEKLADFRYELCILDKTIDELNNIIKTQKGKDKRSASLALQLIEVKPIKKIKTESGKTDDLMVKVSDKDTIVATQDKNLRKRLKARRIRLIGIRQKKYLAIDRD
jgi:rRNA-processing protein FCF1